MNKKVNELIPKALEAIKASKMANDDNKVDKEFKGYISSMGASIIQSGLIATLAFYSNESSDSKVKRSNLLKAIHFLIAPQGNTEELLHYVLNKTKPDERNEYSASELKKDELQKLETQISDALIALKLALRTFKQKEE